jgi:hypothetical protein
MASNQVILAIPPSGSGVAIGPFKSRRTADRARKQIDQLGWDYHDTVTLISGGDLKSLGATAR